MQDNNYTSYRAPRSYRGAPGERGGRSSATTLYLTVAAAVAAALGALMSVNVFFNLKTGGVQISGTQLYTAEQILYVGGIAEGQNLVRMNTEFVAKRLKSNLVYIDDVSIEKNYLDGGLTVNITEAETEAMIEAEDGTYCTLSKSGRILETGIAEWDKSIPLVTGYELSSQTPGKKAKSSDEQKTEILSELFEQLDALDFGNIVKIDISDRTDITMNYDNRIELSLGSSVNMDIKLSDLKKVIESLPNGYAGTLIYRSKDAGISAIPKEAEVPSAYVDNSSEEDDSSLEDRDDSQYGYGSDTTDDGNYDDGNYGGYGDNGDYTDNGYGYGDGDGYSGYGDDSDDGDDYGYGGYNYDDGYGDNGGDGYDYNYNYDYGTDGYSEDTYGTDNGYGY